MIFEKIGAKSFRVANEVYYKTTLWDYPTKTHSIFKLIKKSKDSKKNIFNTSIVRENLTNSLRAFFYGAPLRLKP